MAYIVDLNRLEGQPFYLDANASSRMSPSARDLL